MDINKLKDEYDFIESLLNLIDERENTLCSYVGVSTDLFIMKEEIKSKVLKIKFREEFKDKLSEDIIQDIINNMDLSILINDSDVFNNNFNVDEVLELGSD